MGYYRGMRGTETPIQLWKVDVQHPLRGGGIVARHFEGEKVLSVLEIERWLGELEQARSHIAALESAMTEAGLELENPWDIIREDIAHGVGGG